MTGSQTVYKIKKSSENSNLGTGYLTDTGSGAFKYWCCKSLVAPLEVSYDPNFIADAILMRFENEEDSKVQLPVDFEETYQHTLKIKQPGHKLACEVYDLDEYCINSPNDHVENELIPKTVVAYLTDDTDALLSVYPIHAEHQICCNLE